MTETAATGFEGFIDHVDWHGMRGWARDPMRPDDPTWLEVQIDDDVPVVFLANLRRQDLVDLGYSSGNFGFDLRFPMPLDPLVPHCVSVNRRSDQVPLMNSPIRLPAAPMGSPERRAAFEATLWAEIAATKDGPELDETIRLLLVQVDMLLDARADAASGGTALHQFRLRWNDHLEGVRVRPPQPDARPFVLIIAAELPESALQISVIRHIQDLGFRVAVIAQRSTATTGLQATSLAAMDVQVLGSPEYFTVEDALRRNHNRFRVVLLWGTLIAASYALLVRLHQQRSRIVSLISDIAIERVETALLLAAAMMNDHLVVESETMRDQIAPMLPGKEVAILMPDATGQEIADCVTPLLPKLRINRPTDDPDAS